MWERLLPFKLIVALRKPVMYYVRGLIMLVFLIYFTICQNGLVVCTRNSEILFLIQVELVKIPNDGTEREALKRNIQN